MTVHGVEVAGRRNTNIAPASPREPRFCGRGAEPQRAGQDERSAVGDTALSIGIEWPMFGGRPARRLEMAGRVFSYSEDELSDRWDSFDDAAHAVPQADTQAASLAGEPCPWSLSTGVGGSCVSRPRSTTQEAAAAPPENRTERAPAALDTSGSEVAETRTTVMLQRISYDLDETDVARVLDGIGLAGTYDAVHVPRNRTFHENLAYAFVNFIRPAHAVECIRLCDGHCFGVGDTPRPWRATFSEKQGGAFVARRHAEWVKKQERKERKQAEGQWH